ncbi:hypothetical protein C8R45DRAFT_1102422 [Mycena sanguinolenta]|nr:hypothetical protein C8R45DRAFT_1102422 [Mycena sanguinolenta]
MAQAFTARHALRRAASGCAIARRGREIDIAHPSLYTMVCTDSRSGAASNATGLASRVSFPATRRHVLEFDLAHGFLLSAPPVSSARPGRTSPVLTIDLLGAQIFWSVEMSYTSPYLLSLGLSTSHVALVFLAGPLGMHYSPFWLSLRQHFKDFPQVNRGKNLRHVSMDSLEG